MKKLFVILVCLAVGCEQMDDSTPRRVNKMVRPVVIVAKDSAGNIVIRGADGEVQCYSHDYYFSQALRSRSIGDTIVPALTPKEGE